MTVLRKALIRSILFAALAIVLASCLPGLEARCPYWSIIMTDNGRFLECRETPQDNGTVIAIIPLP